MTALGASRSFNKDARMEVHQSPYNSVPEPPVDYGRGAWVLRRVTQRYKLEMKIFTYSWGGERIVLKRSKLSKSPEASCIRNGPI
jgi:hypothetical protein